jgi:hypothetical protein
MLRRDINKASSNLKASNLHSKNKGSPTQGCQSKLMTKTKQGTTTDRDDEPLVGVHTQACQISMSIPGEISRRTRRRIPFPIVLSQANLGTHTKNKCVLAKTATSMGIPR